MFFHTVSNNPQTKQIQVSLKDSAGSKVKVNLSMERSKTVQDLCLALVKEQTKANIPPPPPAPLPEQPPQDQQSEQTPP